MAVVCEAIRLSSFESPLRFSFRHATKTHRRCEALIVTVSTSSGQTGLGEVQVRSYLSGESLGGARAFIQSKLWPLVQSHSIASVSELWTLLQKIHKVAEDARAPASYAGLELAIVSAYCAATGGSLDEAVAQFFDEETKRKSVRGEPEAEEMAPLPMAPGLFQKLILQALKLSGARAIKIKVGAGDVHRIARLVAAVPDLFTAVGVDANGAIPAGEWLSSGGPNPRLSFIEQPTSSVEEKHWPAIRQKLACPLVADESLCTVADAMRLRQNTGCGGWNVRYAKNGGFVGIKHILGLVPASPFRLHLGSLVGETVVLRPAFLALAKLGVFDLTEPSHSRLLLRRQPRE